jgi:putative ABC transport system substrate-binding protein
VRHLLFERKARIEDVVSGPAAGLFQKRRALVLGGVAALLAGTHAFSQIAGRTYRVAALLPLSGLTAQPYLQALREGLAEHGFEEGRNLAIEPYYPDTRAEARAVDTSHHDLVFACTAYVTESVLAQKSATPVVFAWVADPVALGFVKNLARPGGRTTGVRNRYYELMQKRVELLRELLPGARRVAAFTMQFDAIALAVLRHARQAAARLGLEVFGVEAPAGWGGAMRAAAAGGADAALMLVPFAEYGMSLAAEDAVQAMLERKLPVMFSDLETVGRGGLIAYATDPADDVRRAADLIGRILKGADPGAIAVDQTARFQLAVNLKSARTIGVEVPRSILLRADKVFE